MAQSGDIPSNINMAAGTVIRRDLADSAFEAYVPATAKRTEAYLGTTDGSGNYTVTYGTAFSSVPDVQPQMQAGAFNQFIRITSSTTTGFTVQVAQRNSVNLLGIDVLLSTTAVVSGASVGVLVTAR